MPSNVVQPNIVSYAPPSVTGGTRYAGYGGIYPQATPLQQVALALRQAPASTAPAVLSTSLSASTTAKTSSTSAEPDKRPPQKRKFQELLVSPKGPTAPSQVICGCRCLINVLFRRLRKNIKINQSSRIIETMRFPILQLFYPFSFVLWLVLSVKLEPSHLKTL